MNQIICTSSTNVEIPNKKYIKKKYYKIVFYILVFISFSFSIYYILYRNDLSKSEKLSEKLLKDYNLTSIYSSDTDYSVDLINREINLENYKDLSSSIIGIIKVKKLNIVYPILSEINNNYLKISPCRFYGPYPNEIGNVCIAAHNYKNETFFSNLSSLINGDIITIYDTLGNNIDYIVYNVYTTNYKDTECLNQNTNNSRVVTLVTCNSVDNYYRTIVKAKEL